MVNLLDYAGTQQTLSNNLNRDQTNEYSGVDFFPMGSKGCSNQKNKDTKDLYYNDKLKSSCNIFGGDHCVNNYCQMI